MSWPLVSYCALWHELKVIRDQRAKETKEPQVVFKSDGLFGVINAQDYHHSMGPKIVYKPPLPVLVDLHKDEDFNWDSACLDEDIHETVHSGKD